MAMTTNNSMRVNAGRLDLLFLAAGSMTGSPEKKMEQDRANQHTRIALTAHHIKT
jgi:hypothetical protein